MNDLTTNTTIVSQFLHSYQKPTPSFHRQGEIDLSKEYELRIEETRRKIIALQRELQPAMFRGEHWRVHGTQMEDIENKIGIYQIAGKNNESVCGWRWRKPTGYGGYEWYDYFGDQSIREGEGGWVVVSLSDEGVSYLNGIAKEVLSSSSYTV